MPIPVDVQKPDWRKKVESTVMGRQGRTSPEKKEGEIKKTELASAALLGLDGYHRKKGSSRREINRFDPHRRGAERKNNAPLSSTTTKRNMDRKKLSLNAVSPEGLHGGLKRGPCGQHII